MFIVGLRYIQFANKQSLADFKLSIAEINVGYPNKVKNRIKIPNTNIYYDYASVFGDLYEERILEYTFLIAGPYALNEAEMERYKADVANWLMPGQEHYLFDSAIPFFYFVGEVQNGPEWEQVDNGYGTFKVKFSCYPYKIKQDDEFDDLWDSFDFENDIAQDLSFTVNGEKEIKVYNTGSVAVYPKLVVTGQVEISVNGFSHTYTAGTYEDKLWKLARDLNTLTLNGNGTLEIHFHKEVL